jgi:hypothetical protein
LPLKGFALPIQFPAMQLQTAMEIESPHQKLLGDGVLTPVPVFCLICTIISNKTGIFD